MDLYHTNIKFPFLHQRGLGIGLRVGLFVLFQTFFLHSFAQINTNRVMQMGKHALYYEDYVLSIQRFNRVIAAKPYLHEPYFYRALAKYYLEDFAGAEADCSASLDRNPYVENTYQLRGLCRVNRQDYEGAIEDYRRVISLEPKNRPCWHNLVLCYFELKRYAAADSALQQMMVYWPRESENFTMKAQVNLAQGDTIGGLACIDSALVLNAYDNQAWIMRSVISLNQGSYHQAETEIDKAILQEPRRAGYYIHRALTRFHQDNLRGAMADYDQALELEPNNYLGHYNRGLLRAQVGDDNRAIEDFNFVLRVEPDNWLALFNRALLLDQTGDYRGAIRDISAVIAEYPDFLVGYQTRAAVRRKLGDSYGAERDEFRVLKARMDAKAGGRHTSARKTRKKSERNIADYNKLVEADTQEPEREYASSYRGRVQDHREELQPLPIYVFTHHRVESEVNKFIPYYKQLDALNASGVLHQPLFLSNAEAAANVEQTQAHFASMAAYTTALEKVEGAVLYIGRALDAYHLRDFESALSDLEKAAALDAKNVIARLLLAQVRYRQCEASSSDDATTPMASKIAYSRVLDDLNKALSLDPKLAYAWYNKGCVHMAMHDYGLAREAFSRALNLEPRFPDAYFNRGIACVLDGQVQMGLSDLSQAGEYGLYQAYNLIKRLSKDKQ